MKKGYYWIKFIDSDEESIGYYEYEGSEEYGQEVYSDGSGIKGDIYNWQVVGSDEIYKNKEIKVLRKVK